MSSERPHAGDKSDPGNSPSQPRRVTRLLLRNGSRGPSPEPMLNDEEKDREVSNTTENYTAAEVAGLENVGSETMNQLLESTFDSESNNNGPGTTIGQDSKSLRDENVNATDRPSTTSTSGPLLLDRQEVENIGKDTESNYIPTQADDTIADTSREKAIHGGDTQNDKNANIHRVHIPQDRNTDSGDLISNESAENGDPDSNEVQPEQSAVLSTISEHTEGKTAGEAGQDDRETMTVNDLTEDNNAEVDSNKTARRESLSASEDEIHAPIHRLMPAAPNELEDDEPTSTARGRKRASLGKNEEVPSKRTHVNDKPQPESTPGTEDENNPPEIGGIRSERAKKRVNGNLIERLWNPLNSDVLRILQRLMTISMGKSVERYSMKTKFGQVRIREAQKALSSAWFDNNSARTFISRLAASNLPPLTSMQPTRSATAGNLSGSQVLEYDQLVNYKQKLETYLLAEISQLQDLELHYNNLKNSYELDLKYLNEFKKTTSINEQRMHDEIIKKKQELQLDSIGSSSDNIKLDEETEHQPILGSKFNANNDPDTREVLKLLNKHLSIMSTNTQALSTLNDRIEMLFNVLEML